MHAIVETPVCTKIAAKHLGLSHRTLEQWRWKGVGPAFIQVGRQIRYHHADLNAFLARNRHDPEAAFTAMYN